MNPTETYRAASANPAEPRTQRSGVSGHAAAYSAALRARLGRLNRVAHPTSENDA